MKVALLLTGNELMTGDTVDSNSSRIAQSLALQGFDVAPVANTRLTVEDGGSRPRPCSGVSQLNKIAPNKITNINLNFIF